jgi:hypothetical protein
MKRLNDILLDLEQECETLAHAFGGKNALWLKRAKAVRAARAGEISKPQLAVLRAYRDQEAMLARMMREAASSERDILAANRGAAEALESVIRRAER